MNYKQLIFALLIGSASSSAFGQGYTNDLLRYSNTVQGGTARSQAVGGAQTALGGDIGSLVSNPAGLGFFRNSEFAVTPSISNTVNNTTYLGNQYSDSKSVFDFTNLGVVWARSTPQADAGTKTSGWLSYAFGLGYNRTNNFGSNFSFNGKNPYNSFTYSLADQANTAPGINFDASNTALDNNIAGQAYNGYLINGKKNPDNTTTYYPAANPTSANPVNQSGSNYQTGSTNDINLSFGTNYGNQLYFGIGANISTLNYAYTFNLLENGIQSAKVDGLAYNENFDASGTGLSAKAGLIFRPDPAIRLGVYAQTPTWYHITEITDNANVLGLDNQGNSIYSPANYVDNSYSYNIQTPWRYNFGASFFINTYGFLTGDVELVDYRSASFHSGNTSYDQSINLPAQQLYRSAVNYRLGAEFKVGQLSLRAGYDLYGNPYSSTSQINNSATSVSGGLGYRIGNVYIDATLVNTKFNDVYNVYPIVNSNGHNANATIAATRTDFMLTLGSKF